MDTIPYTKARFIAYRALQLLAPHCHLIDVAGSIRRERPQVKDIEIVCMPQKEFIKTDLFDGGYESNTSGFIEAVKKMMHEHIKGDLQTGRYVKLILKGGYPMDLFIPAPEDYYRQLAIRTGSREYSHAVIAGAWHRKGWCGSDKGFRKISACQQTPSGWKCVNVNAEKPPMWTSEKDFFEWLGIKFIDPKYREINQTS